MDRHNVIDEDLATLCNSIPQQLVRSSLYFALTVLRKRDRARFGRVCAELRPLEDKAKQPDFDWKVQAFLLQREGGARYVAFERSYAALRCDYDATLMHLKNTPRHVWPSVIDKVLAILVRPTTLSSSIREDLEEQLRSVRTVHEAALLIVAATRMKDGGIDLDPDTIGSMLRRGPHRSVRPRRTTR